MKYLVFSISSFSAVNHCFFFFLSQATTDFGNHRNPGHYFNARKVLCETFIVKKRLTVGLILLSCQFMF